MSHVPAKTFEEKLTIFEPGQDARQLTDRLSRHILEEDVVTEPRRLFGILPSVWHGGCTVSALAPPISSGVSSRTRAFFRDKAK